MNGPLKNRSASGGQGLSRGCRTAARDSRRGIPMTKSSAFAKSALAAAAGLVALGCAAAAQAQPYGGPGYSNYDGCRRDAGNRGIVGALIGGGIGATVGSQVAANHHRSDGSLLGGALGAIAGAAIGNNTAACPDAPLPPVAEY